MKTLACRFTSALPLLTLLITAGCSSASDPCAPGGVIHGTGDDAHCDCARGYRSVGLACVALEAGADLAPAGDMGASADAMPADLDGCGPHGTQHDAHCHCDPGYYEEPGTLMCVALPPCTTANDAIEPNDLPAQATAWEDRHAGSALRICPGDYDFFKLSLSAGQRLTIDLRFKHTEGDLNLLLWAPGKNPLREAPDARSQSQDDDEQIRHTATVAGEHLFIVIGAKPTSQAGYELQLSR